MKIAGWTCIVGAGGVSRAASHPDNGNAVWIQGRFMGNGDVPPAVFEWLIRPQLRAAWNIGAFSESMRSLADNPYAGEPPDKDSDPS